MENEQIITQLENKRIKYLFFISGLMIISLIILLIAFIFKNSSYIFIALVCIGAGGIIMFPIHYYLLFKKELKTKYVPEIIKKLPDISHSNTRRINVSIINSSLLFGHVDTVETDDCFCGKYKDINFDLAEVKLSDTYWFQNKPESYNVFKGVVIVFPFNKKILSHTIVTTKRDININSHIKWPLAYMLVFGLITILGILVFGGFKFISAAEPGAEAATLILKLLLVPLIALGVFKLIIDICKKRNNMSFSLKDDKIELEDIKFSKRFNVYSKNQVEARYLVSPSFMERFLNLTTAFGTKKAKCAFFEDKIMIAIFTTKNLFETGNLFTSLRNNKNLQTFLEELSSIYRMIEYFKLDENTNL